MKCTICHVGLYGCKILRTIEVIFSTMYITMSNHTCFYTIHYTDNYAIQGRAFKVDSFYYLLVKRDLIRANVYNLYQ